MSPLDAITDTAPSHRWFGRQEPIAHIYFDSDRTGRPEIWKVSRLGGEPLQVSHNGGENPFESPDGRYLYYGRDRHLWRMPLNGGPEERLFESLIITLAASPDEHRVIYGRRTQTDSDLVLVEFPP